MSSLRRAERGPQHLRFLAPGLLLLAAGCSSTGEEERDVVWLVRHGQFGEAYREAQVLADERPDDPQAQALLRDAEVAYVLHLGRSAVFEERPEEGLECFYRALELAPDNQVVQGWVLKTRVQLAEENLEAARELAQRDLARAEEIYETVLEYLPEEDHSDRIAEVRRLAKLGLSRVLVTQNYRLTQSRSYFRDGMRGLRFFQLEQSLHDFSGSLKYDEDFDRARDRRVDVEAVMASEKLAKAKGLEAENYFHAARNEYRIVLLMDGTNEEALDGLDRMDMEVRAHGELAEAEMDILRGDFDGAQEGLQKAGELTQDQADSLGRLSAELEEARYSEMYEEARGLERDNRYPEAVEAYSKLLEEAEYYEDAIARRKTLLGFIERAEELYAAALEAADDETAAEKLREIPVFWPEYRDVEARLEVLEARLAENAPPEEPATGESPEPDGEDAETPEEGA